MSYLIWTLTGAFIVLVVAVAALVFTPLRLDVLGRTTPQPSVRVVARLFGGRTPALVVMDSASIDQPRRRASAWGSKSSKRDNRGGLNAREIRRAVVLAPRLVADITRQIRFDHLWLDADVGLADPAETGMLYGQLAPVMYSVPPMVPVSIQVRPDFSGPRVDGTIDAGIRVIPAKLIIPLSRFAWRVFRPRK